MPRECGDPSIYPREWQTKGLSWPFEWTVMSMNLLRRYLMAHRRLRWRQWRPWRKSTRRLERHPSFYQRPSLPRRSMHQQRSEWIIMMLDHHDNDVIDDNRIKLSWRDVFVSFLLLSWWKQTTRQIDDDEVNDWWQGWRMRWWAHAIFIFLSVYTCVIAHVFVMWCVDARGHDFVRIPSRDSSRFVLVSGRWTDGVDHYDSRENATHSCMCQEGKGRPDCIHGSSRIVDTHVEETRRLNIDRSW